MPSNKQFGDGVNIREAYSASHLSTLLVSNQHAVDLTDDGCERLLSVMDEFDCLHCITNNWDSMARENLGSSGDTPNYYAIGTINIDVSTNRQAWLLEDGYAVQQEWLDRGDGRLTRVKEIDVTDGDYVDDVGACWFPKQYTFAFTEAD